MKKSLISWLFTFIILGLITKGLRTTIGSILIPIAFVAYLIWFFSGMPGADSIF